MTLDLNAVRLGRGAHPLRENPTGDRDMCIMEAVALFAGEPWSDRPKCACPVVSGFLRLWNDRLPEKQRDRLLAPSVWVPKLINSRQNPDIEAQRTCLLLDWLVRTYAPAWLDLVPSLADEAAILRGLPEIDTVSLNNAHIHQSLDQVRLTAEKAQRDATAAAEKARGSGSLFMPVSGTAHAVMSVTAGYATKDTVEGRIETGMNWRAAGIAYAAAYIAALSRVDPAPTVETLQQSVLDLLDRMLAVGQRPLEDK